MSSDLSELNRLVTALIRSSNEMCENVGGYPDDVRIVGDHLVIATTDSDGGPSLSVYTTVEALNWWRLALEYRKANPDLSLGDCLMETESDVSTV